MRLKPLSLDRRACILLLHIVAFTKGRSVHSRDSVSTAYFPGCWTCQGSPIRPLPRLSDRQQGKGDGIGVAWMGLSPAARLRPCSCGQWQATTRHVDFRVDFRVGCFCHCHFVTFLLSHCLVFFMLSCWSCSPLAAICDSHFRFSICGSYFISHPPTRSCFTSCLFASCVQLPAILDPEFELFGART